MRIVAAGASGLIGRPLLDQLRDAGHDVLRLVRREPRGQDEARWDPGRHQLDPALLEDAGAVVCLSGVGVGDNRWTESYKQLIAQSRVDSVGTVARSLAEAGGDTALISASAVGYYGDTGDRVVDEDAPAGDTFLAGVCELWEAAAAPAAEAGHRVAHLRTGLVLSKDGGLLQRLAPIVKAGLGGKLGSGRQYMPWISLADELAAIRFVVEHDVSGPVNLTGPHPVTNAEFTRTLGSVLHRPTIFTVPGFAARIALGEFAENVLTGQNAVPARLTEAGFAFTHPRLEQALRAELR